MGGGSKSDRCSGGTRNRIEIGSNFASGPTWDFWTRGVPGAISDKRAASDPWRPEKTSEKSGPGIFEPRWDRF